MLCALYIVMSSKSVARKEKGRRRLAQQRVYTMNNN